MKKIIQVVLIVTISLSACAYPRDRAYWKKHRQEFLILSEEVRALHKKTGIGYFTRYTVGRDPNTEIKIDAIPTHYPKYESEIKRFVDKLISMKIIDCSVGDGYVSFSIKSGGLVTDKVLVNIINENGLVNFAKDDKKFGLEISFKMELEKDWLYIYTD